MTPFRRHLLRHRALAAWLVALALAMKLLAPAGFMPAVSGRSITITLCSGYGPMAMTMPGMTDKADHGDHHGKQEMPCGFGGLTMPGLTGADPLLLAVAIAFIIARGFLRVPTRVRETPYRLRPPAIGPPLTA